MKNLIVVYKELLDKINCKSQKTLYINTSCMFHVNFG